MTLTRKLLLINLVLLASVAVLSGLLLVSLRGMSRTVMATASEYEELRILESVTLATTLARQKAALASDPSSATYEVDLALSRIRAFQVFQASETASSARHQAIEQAFDRTVERNLLEARTMLESGEGREAIVRLDTAIAVLADLSAGTDVAGTARTADARVRALTTLAVGVFLAIVAGATAASLAGYWTIMSPLRRLQSRVRSLAQGRFTEKLPPESDPEFAGLAHDFNRMTDELAGLYRTLEERVVEKSRELVRSERLASVGFLAAGVAHEINNPIGIISGYAEMSERWLESTPDEARLKEVRDALRVIHEEAFRCKDITGKLLTMARMGDGSRGPVDLARVASEVVEMLRGLPRFRDRTLALRVNRTGAAVVIANEQEMRQVLLNLLLNALEAVEPASGKVEVSVEQRSGQVELAVADNGRGMSEETRSKIFEPFFSARTGNGRRGTGLGLSVSHAIVESHRGRLDAESDGPGRGSIFRVTIPANGAAIGEETHGDHGQ